MKTLAKAQWDALKYPAMVRELSEEEGGGWLAWIPVLGEGLFRMNGETAAEALQLSEAHRRDCYDLVIASGQPIPLPDTETKRASGRWLMRATPRLHAELQGGAARENASFNSYCISCLERGHMMQSFDSYTRETTQSVKAELKSTIREIAREEIHAAHLEYSGAAAEVDVSWNTTAQTNYSQPEQGERLRLVA